MKVLAINCGSSTLKFQFIEAKTQGSALRQERLAYGIIDRIGSQGTIRFTTKSGKHIRETAVISDHGEALRYAVEWLQSLGLLGASGEVAVGHRVVHGGDSFKEPTLIDDKVMDTMEAVSRLAPLHNRPSLIAIRAAKEVLGHSVPQVATFDTTFHGTLPKRSYTYAIPLELAEKHRIRRYGFHGLAHRYMTERYAVLTSTPLDQAKIITLQLGNGCSATAINSGSSVDTSMGFTPLEGLMMGTRSGDLDPSLLSFLAHREGVDIEEVENWLNTRSGLLGISGYSKDMRAVLEAEDKGNTRAALAVEMFCYRVRKYIGAYLAALGGAEAVVFGGGIGENSPRVRARICSNMEWCSLMLDEERNAQAMGIEARISTDYSKVHVYVIPVDEETVIVHDTIQCLRQCREHSRFPANQMWEGEIP